MKIIILLLVLATTFIQAQEYVSKQKAIIEIDGKEHTVTLGETSKLPVDGKQHLIKVTLDPLTEFNQAGIKFNYPSKLHFEFEALSKEVRQWNIDGNNTAIIVQEYTIPTTKEELLDAFKEQYELMNAKVNESKIVFKASNHTLEGVVFNINMGSIILVQELYILLKGKNTSVLLLQDLPNDDGSHTGEFVTIKNMIADSIQIDQNSPHL